MDCPHCGTRFHAETKRETVHIPFVDEEPSVSARVEFTDCIACHGLILYLVWSAYNANDRDDEEVGRELLWPRNDKPPSVPSEVPEDVARPYREARLVLNLSPMAAAALGRRCLQHVLRTAGGVKPGDLYDEIQAVLDEGKLPPTLAESLDAVRVVGNLAAHPIKSQQTGEALDVEPGEAEWVLDTLDGLFGFYYVLPAQMLSKRAALNARLAEAGKPPLR